MKMDAESIVVPEATPAQIPSVSFRSMKSAGHGPRSAASSRTSTSEGSLLPSLPHLSELILVVGADRRQEVVQVHVQYTEPRRRPARREGSTRNPAETFPTLRQFVRPTEWQTVSNGLQQFANRARSGNLQEGSLGKVWIRMLDNPSKYMQARRSSLSFRDRGAEGQASLGRSANIPTKSRNELGTFYGHTAVVLPRPSLFECSRDQHLQMQWSVVKLEHVSHMLKEAQKQAVFVAEDWGACARGLACVATRFPLRYRQVWCADSDNVSIALLPELCSGLMPRMEEPCPAHLIPPECGWTIGSWSPCFSLPPSEVTDNATELCNATGMGKQYRGVSCLSSGSVPEADECKLPRPSGDRSCRCISSQVSQLSLLDQGMGDSSVQVASASMTLVGVLTACVLCTCISFGCFLLTSRRSTSVKKADALAEFDSYVLTSKEKQYKHRVAPAPSKEEQQDVTVCVANSRQSTRNEGTSDFETASESTASVGSAIPSPTSSGTGSRTTQMAPLASPCSVSSVASQPVRVSPLPSPSTLSISSISAVLQSPAHSAGYGSGTAESGETVFLALSSPSNAGSPTRSPKRRPTLPAVSETEAHLTQTSQEPPVDHPHSLASEEQRSTQVASARPRRKKNAPRPPTLQMDLCGPEEDQEVVPFASPSKRSPQKARDTPAERGDFSPVVSTLERAVEEASKDKYFAQKTLEFEREQAKQSEVLTADKACQQIEQGIAEGKISSPKPSETPKIVEGPRTNAIEIMQNYIRDSTEGKNRNIADNKFPILGTSGMKGIGKTTMLKYGLTKVLPDLKMSAKGAYLTFNGGSAESANVFWESQTQQRTVRASVGHVLISGIPFWALSNA
ncbi:unnamed protein product [Symbiodinium sp. CCMP2592]|nr:unnamed protein product [Symbiodinium sp. CCMP2592]